MCLYSAICFSIQFCSTGPECEPLPLQAETEHHDGAAAVIKCEKVWQREILKVYFMNPPVLDSWRIGVTTQQILDWANEAWRKDPMNSNIPEFNLCEVLNKADIRVKFAGKPIKSMYSQLDLPPHLFRDERYQVRGLLVNGGHACQRVRKQADYGARSY